MANPFNYFFRSAPAKAIAAPATPEQIAEDQKLVEKSISDAVNSAILGEEFTKAVANHLASQIQPSIKTALDISAVEKNILASNEKLSIRINQIDIETISKLRSLAHLETSVSALAADVEAIKGSTQTPDSFKVVLAQLENVRLELVSAVGKQGGLVLDAVESQNGTLSAINSAGKGHADALAEIKASTDSQVAALSAIKFPSLDTLESKVNTISTTVSEINSKDSSSEILAGVKAANEPLSASISEIKTIVSAPAAPAEKVDISGLETALSKITSDIDSQNATLTEIKSTVATPAVAAEKVDISGLETSLKQVISDIDAQNATLADIKSTVATPAVVEKTDLSGLETSVNKVITSLDSQTATLSEIKAAAAKESNAALESSVQKVISTLDSQSGVLSEIKTVVATPTPAAEKTDLSGLESSVGKVITALDAQSATLTDIKTATSGSEVATALSAQSATLAEIKDSKVSSEILTAVQSVKTDIAASKTKLDSLSTDDVIAEVKTVKVLIEAIPAPAALPLPVKESKTNGTPKDEEAEAVAA